MMIQHIQCCPMNGTVDKEGKPRNADRLVYIYVQTTLI